MNLDMLCELILAASDDVVVVEKMEELNRESDSSLDFSQFPNNFNLVRRVAEKVRRLKQ